MSSASLGRTYWWEVPPEDAGGNAEADEEFRQRWESDSESDGEPSPEEAGDCLADLLIELKHKAVLSAKQCCTIAYWCDKAGARGPVQQLAFRLDAPTGHYQRHLDAVLQTREEDERLYTLHAPGYDKKYASRQLLQFQVAPAHESLAEEIVHDVSIVDALLERLREGTMPAQYSNHPVVRTAPAGTRVIPYTLYMDAAPYSKVDSVLGIFVYFEVSPNARRHLVASISKRKLCKCGCRGWCTLVNFLWCIRWMIEAGAEGIFPPCRHDQSPFGVGDETRDANAGAEMAARFCLLWLKGDWSEYCGTLGFPQWSSVNHPCIWCTCTRENMFSMDPFAPGVFPHILKDMDSYERDCSACEIKVRVQEARQHARLKAALFYDKRTAGNKGRCLSMAFPELGLRVGDRLEPSANLRDVAEYDSLPLPSEVVFWRCSSEASTKHRNPMFSRSLGVTLSSMVVDMLHALHLGVLQKYVAFVWWSLIWRNAWSVTATNEEELIVLSVHRLRADLYAWYPSYTFGEGGPNATKLSDLSLKTLGPKGAYMLKTKGAMTRPLVPFCIYLLRRYNGILANHAAALKTGEALDRILVVLKGQSHVVSATAIQAQNNKRVCVCVCERPTHTPSSTFMISSDIHIVFLFSDIQVCSRFYYFDVAFLWNVGASSWNTSAK